MLRKHRNALLEMIRAANMAPKEFKPKEEMIDTYQAFRLQVGDSPLYFVFWETIVSGGRRFDYEYSEYERAHPKPDFPEIAHTNSWYSFEMVGKAFKQWLETPVRKYLTDRAEEAEDQMLPDLWSELDWPSGSSADSQALQNTFFTLEEQARISETLNEFEKEVQKREILSEEQLELLQERIEYLVESSKRLGRKDWLAAAAGALMGFTFQAGLTSDAATQIIRLAGEALRWIAHTPLLLL